MIKKILKSMKKFYKAMIKILRNNDKDLVIYDKDCGKQ